MKPWAGIVFPLTIGVKTTGRVPPTSLRLDCFLSLPPCGRRFLGLSRKTQGAQAGHVLADCDSCGLIFRDSFCSVLSSDALTLPKRQSSHRSRFFHHVFYIGTRGAIAIDRLAMPPTHHN